MALNTLLSTCVLALVVARPAQAQRAATGLESGDRIRLLLGDAAGGVADGTFWSLDSRGIRLADQRGRPLSFPWEGIERLERWQPAAGNVRTKWLAAGIGAVLLGAQFGRLASGLSEGDARQTVLGASLGALGGAALGWVIGHAITDSRGSWIEVPLDAIRSPP